MTRVETTARRLFAELESAGIAYAVLRNYEYLFHLQKENAAGISDIDLVMDSRDLDSFRQMLANLAAEEGWDAAIECDHWAQSPMAEHRIEVFRLYSKDPLVCLEIDVFHAFLTHGVPLFGEDELLEGRERDARSGVMRIDLHQENTIRLIQIAGLADAPRKRARYCRRLVAHLREHENAFVANVRGMDVFIGRAVAALKKTDVAGVERWMALGRAWFFARYAMRHPVKTAGLLWHRLGDQWKRFYAYQCGFVARLHAPAEAQRAMIRAALDEMIAGNFINQWREATGIGLRERKRMEQTSIVIRWADAETCEASFAHCETREEIAAGLFDLVTSRHRQMVPMRARVAEHA